MGAYSDNCSFQRENIHLSFIESTSISSNNVLHQLFSLPPCLCSDCRLYSLRHVRHWDQYRVSTIILFDVMLCIQFNEILLLASSPSLDILMPTAVVSMAFSGPIANCFPYFGATPIGLPVVDSSCVPKTVIAMLPGGVLRLVTLELGMEQRWRWYNVRVA